MRNIQYIHTLYSQKPAPTPESSCVPPAEANLSFLCAAWLLPADRLGGGYIHTLCTRGAARGAGARGGRAAAAPPATLTFV
jgi:hypothetical protein